MANYALCGYFTTTADKRDDLAQAAHDASLHLDGVADRIAQARPLLVSPPQQHVLIPVEQPDQ
jgi:hypothetical protein